MRFDNDPSFGTVKAHFLFDVALLAVLLLYMAVWGLSYRIVVGVAAISFASTLGTYTTYRRQRWQRRHRPNG